MRNDCQSFQDRIADLVTGTVPEPDRRKIEDHAASCAPCREYLQALRREDARLTQHFAGIDANRVERQERMIQRIRCTCTKPKRHYLSLWREIMRSPFSKLATAATVVLVAAVSLVVLDRSAAPAYALADVSAAFDQAHVIHVQGWQYFPRLPQSDGTPRPPVAINTWIDQENGRLRQMQVAVAQSMRMAMNAPPDVNTTVTVTETVCDGSYVMTINHTAKTATYTRISDYGRLWTTRRQAQMLWGQLCSQPAQLENFVKVGRDDIDSSPCDVWQLDAAGGMGGLVSGGGGGAGGWSSSGTGQVQGSMDVEGMIPTLQSKLWISTTTGRLSRAQVQSRIGDGHWLLEQDYHTVDYDMKIPANTFSMEPPAGYTATNTRETALLQELPRATSRVGNLEYATLTSFTLSNGSVVVGWQSLDRNTKETQEPLFANVFFGGPLPRLPVELYALKPAGAPDRTAYTACHLGRTAKAGRITEWALYVPKTLVPANVKYLGYDLMTRFNTAASSNGGMGGRVPYGVPVQTAADFDKWVRGAMAELSDNAAAPADVTYQKVTDLARQISTPSKP
jgi:hypothetical protein